MKRTKKVISLMLTLALLLTLLPAAAYADVTGAGTEDDPYVVTARCDLETKMAGASDPVSYIDADGVTQSRETYTVFSNQTSLANNQWYVVSADAAVSSLYVSGTAHLILCDGVTLTVTGGVRVPSGSTLNIYAQSTSYFKGKLASNTSDAKGAGIEVAGTLVICGGDITATGGSQGGAGIGGASGYSGNISAGGTCGTVTICGGEVTATGGSGAAGIGGGKGANSYYVNDTGYDGGAGGTIAIHGGTITATGTDGGAGIGGGVGGDGDNFSASIPRPGGVGGAGGNITITGGVVNTSSIGGGQGGTGSPASGSLRSGAGGEGGEGGTITISGGSIVAGYSGGSGAGIGGGKGGTGGDGGTSYQGGKGGTGGSAGNITINGGRVNTISIGGGPGGDGGAGKTNGVAGNATNAGYVTLNLAAQHDWFKAYGYSCAVTLASPVTADFSSVLTGTQYVSAAQALAGLTLYPVRKITLPEGLTASGGKVFSFNGGFWAGIGAEVRLTAPAGMEFTALTVQKAGGGSVGVTVIGGTAIFTMPAAAVTVTATLEPLPAVTYIDENGTEQTLTDYTVLAGYGETLTSGWYVVRGTIYYGNGSYCLNIAADADARLILTDGARICCQGKRTIVAADNSTLSVYGQSQGTGEIECIESEGSLEVFFYNLSVYGGNLMFSGAYDPVLNIENDLTVCGGSITAYSGGKFGGNCTGIWVTHDFTVLGGSVTATGHDYGILACNQITVLGGSVTATGGNKGIWGLDQIALGWRSPADRIYASSYEYGAYGDGGSLLIAAGRYLYNGEEVLGGTVTDLTKVNDKTLQPAVKITLPEGVTAAGTEVINQTDGIYALPGAAVTLDAREGLALAGAPTVQTAGGSSVTVTESGGAYTFTMPAEDVTVTAGIILPSLNYIDENGEEQTLTEYTVLTGAERTLNGGWYVAQGNVTFDKTIDVISGDVRLILADGASMHIGTSDAPLSEIGISYSSSTAALSIYAQSGGTGSLEIQTIGGRGINVPLVSIYGGHITISASHEGIIASNTLKILGGNVDITGNTGNYGRAGIYAKILILGWKNTGDSIYANTYRIDNGGALSVTAGQFLYNGTEVLGGLITDLTKVNDKTLQSAVKITLPEGVTAAGTGVINQTDGTYALPGATVTLDAGEGLALAGAPTVQTAGGSSVTVTESGGAYTFTMPAEDVTVTAVLEPAGPAPIPGDVDGDGVVSYTDVTSLYMYLIGIITEIDEVNADVDGDGVVSYTDVTSLYMYLIGVTAL